MNFYPNREATLTLKIVLSRRETSWPLRNNVEVCGASLATTVPEPVKTLPAMQQVLVCRAPSNFD